VEEDTSGALLADRHSYLTMLVSPATSANPHGIVVYILEMRKQNWIMLIKLTGP
jgi:phenylpyruvate tautomerase PptA (4-oxalocrotonate tautomerase family)